MHNPEIFIFDDFHPEDNAMLQALYSRSPAPVLEHIDKVKAAGSGKFMGKFYVGYGHLSIADCGSTTIFIENVSMFVAKAIQQWPLYNGQECSTRYIDYSNQALNDPLNTPESMAIQKKWMDFYFASLEPLQSHLKTIYPIQDGEKEKVYDKAIAARGFDVLRGFLPAGTTTSLSWHTNLRQAWDKLSLLRYYPLQEVRDVAEQILSKLQEKYENSFSHKLYEQTEDYRKYSEEHYTFYNPKDYSGEFIFSTNIQETELAQYQDLLDKRPPKTNLPFFLAELGTCTFEFLLDFGSFRDLQRHRNGVCRMPLMTTNYGFFPWYLEQLSPELREKAEALIQEQTASIHALDATDEVKQYYMAMGYQLPCKVTYGLPATVYTLELRAGKTVHPSLRQQVHLMVKALQDRFPNLPLHADMDKDDWDIRRGTQDITQKED